MVRKLTLQDREIFLELSREFYASPAVEHDVSFDYHTRAFDELMRSDEYIAAYLLCDGTHAAGFALLQKTYSREAGGLTVWIDEIYLRPEARGKGLAREFFSFVATLGAKRLRLEVEPDNTRAIRLYRALGYRELPYRSMVMDVQDKAQNVQNSAAAASCAE